MDKSSFPPEGEQKQLPQVFGGVISCFCSTSHM